METRHKYLIVIAVIVLAVLLLVTCQPASAPSVTETQKALETDTSPPPTTKPTRTEPTEVVQPSPTPTAYVEKSPLWYEYRDPLYGYGMAIPCFWNIYPTRADAVAGSPGIASYDEPFARSHSIRGSWIDGAAPDRAVKIDIFTFEDIDTSVPFLEAVAAQLEQGNLDVDGIDPFEGFGADVFIVKANVEGDDPTSLAIPDQHIVFQLSESSFSLFTAYPRSAFSSPDIQAILTSFVPTVDQEIVTPVEDPQMPVEGRSYYVDPDAGYCFSYPSEAVVESYSMENEAAAGKTFIITLEREEYTIMLSGSAMNVPDNYTLNDFIGGYLMETYGIDPGQAYIYSETFGAQEAVIIEGIPENPGVREVLNVIDNRMCHLIYSNSAPENEQAVNDMGELHFIISSSTTFLP